MIKTERVTGILKIIILIYFIYLLTSRFFYLHSDFPKDDIYSAYWSCNIEEKAGAYNARNKVLFGDWDSGGVNYQPMVMMPLSNLISLSSFALSGVSLFSLRAPYALISVLAFLIFFLVLKKEFGRSFALFGTILFSSIHLITCLNRSATAENIFILFMVTAMFSYQKFLKTKQDIYLFLFGLFSALNVAVKLPGINFVIITLIFVFLATAGSREITFSRKKTILAKSLLGIIAGVVIYLLLFRIFYMPGGIKSIMMMSPGSMRFRIYLMFYALISDVPNIFLLYAPIITLLITTSLLFLILPFKNSLTKLDLFNMAWLILGILIILPFIVYYKRIIFLFPPICYLITKTFYMFWQGCKDRNEASATKVRFLFNLVVFIIFLRLSLFSLDYSRVYFPGVYESYNANAGFIRNIFSFLMVFSVIILPLPFFVFHKRFLRYRYESLRLSFYICFIIFSVMIASSIAMNESLNFRRIYFPKGGLSFESYNYSKDIGRLLEPTTILGPEVAFRILGFENRHKFLFRQDGSNLDNSFEGPGTYEKDLERQTKDILANNQIRYFCLFYYWVKIREYLDGIEKIKGFYPDTKLLRRYNFGPLYIELYDKYPSGKYKIVF